LRLDVNFTHISNVTPLEGLTDWLLTGEIFCCKQSKLVFLNALVGQRRSSLTTRRKNTGEDKNSVIVIDAVASSKMKQNI
jgi:hypothetical protein